MAANGRVEWQCRPELKPGESTRVYRRRRREVHWHAARLGFGRIAVTEIAPPVMFANLLQSG
jgi:hypothetical protein